MAAKCESVYAAKIKQHNLCWLLIFNYVLDYIGSYISTVSVVAIIELLVYRSHKVNKGAFDFRPADKNNRRATII